MVGVFALFAFAVRHPALRRAAANDPLTKALVDSAFDGRSRHRSQGPRRLCQRRLSGPDRRQRCARRRPGRAGVHRRSGRSPRRSTACSRPRARGAACRKRCASAGGRRAGPLAAYAGAPARQRRPQGPHRGLDRRRYHARPRSAGNVFQELQHAIDYLDHAPAGFFSADAQGRIVYLNATLAAWLDYDLAEVGSGGLKLADIVPATARRC